MFTRRKLLSLPPRTRQRKILRLLEDWTFSLREAPASWPASFNAPLAAELLETLRDDELSEGCRTALERVKRLLAAVAPTEALPWELGRLSSSLQATLGLEPADWDLRLPGSGRLDPAARTRFPLRIYLDGLRSPFNLGSIFRTAEAFGASEVLLSPGTARPDQPRAKRSAMGSVDVLPWRYAEEGELAGFPNVFALELGGTALSDFAFPAEGICILGNEELGVSPEARCLAEKSLGLVSIPLYGAKGSLNVSVAFGILLHAWVEAVRDLTPGEGRR